MTKLRQLLLVSVLMLATTLVADQEGRDPETVELPPMQVLAKSVELAAHHSTRDGKKILEYIRVNRVTKGSMADRAGLKPGDRIVAIGGWRLTGQELTALLDRDFPTQRENGEALLILTVRRPRHGEDHDVIFRYRIRNPTPQQPKPDKAHLDAKADVFQSHFVCDATSDLVAYCF